MASDSPSSSDDSPSANLLIYLSLSVSIRLIVCQSGHLGVCLVCACVPVCLSVCLPVCLSVCLPPSASTNGKTSGAVLRRKRYLGSRKRRLAGKAESHGRQQRHSVGPQARRETLFGSCPFNKTHNAQTHSMSEVQNMTSLRQSHGAIYLFTMRDCNTDT